MLLASALIPALAQNSSEPPVSPQTPASPPGIDAILLAKANAGDPAAQVSVGESYASGHGVPQDYQQAADWYRKAANQSSVDGELQLAALYRDGRGKAFARDIVQAAEWYRKAAEQGDPTAQGTLGVLYSMGQGVPRSDPDAYYWLDLAAGVKGPNQEKYAATRQLIGTRITADELADVQDREAKWLAAHPRPGATE